MDHLPYRHATYFCATIIPLYLVFLTFVRQFGHHQITVNEEKDHVTWILFTASFSVSIPLLYRFVVDQAVETYSEGWKAISTSQIADGFSSLSLFVTGCIFISNKAYTTDFLHVILSHGEGLLVCGMYGRLLAHSEQIWCPKTCWVLALLFILSDLLMVHHIRQCKEDDGEMNYCTNRSLAMASMIVTTITIQFHIFFIYRFFARARKVNTVSELKGDKVNKVMAKYSTLAMMALILLFLVGHLGSAVFDYVNGDNSNSSHTIEALRFELILFSVSAMIASILPCNLMYIGRITGKAEIDAKETFLRYISHEIRSPLSTTTLGLDYLVQKLCKEDRGDISLDEIEEVVRDAKLSAEIATSTMNDLLLFDKITSSNFEIFPRTIRGWRFVKDCVRPFKTQAIMSNLTFKCSLENEIHQDMNIVVDRPKMEQVVRNFITNAIKFTPSGGTLVITVSVLDNFCDRNPKHLMLGDGGIMRIAVRDTGAGISKENLPRLFGQYVQFDANKLQNGGGSGLGLWLSKSIVEMHGGIIGATSDGDGRGSTFFCELPCFNSNEQEPSLSGASASSLKFGTALEPKVSTLRRANSKSAGSISHSELDSSGSSSLHPRQGPSISNATAAHGQQLANRLKDASLERNIDNMAVDSTNTSSASGSANTENVLSSAPVVQDLQLTEHSLRVNEVRNVEEVGYGVASIREYSIQRPSLVEQATADVPNATTSPSRRTSPRSAAGTMALAGRQVSGIDMGDESDEDDAEVSGNTKDYCVLINENSELKLLLIDDAPLARKMVARTLQPLCRSIDHAKDGLEGVNKVVHAVAGGDPYDVVVIDNYMPVLTGHESIKAMRDRGHVGVILACTGSTHPADRDRLIEAGADAVMIKPLTLNLFTETMYGVLYAMHG
mmetsp:Transcript_24831/g.41380  ORF Transcript_24831/g.41380 Transcript_24831/m.41380 type:complete len:896 (-) Transcript_24831:188-2875(-)